MTEQAGSEQSGSEQSGPERTGSDQPTQSGPVTAEGRRRASATVAREYEVPTRAPRLADAGRARWAMRATFVVWVAATLTAGTSLVTVPSPDWIHRPAAAVLLVVFSVGLTHRAGGHMRIWTSLSIVLGALAVATQLSVLVAAAAVATGVLGSVWAVVVTRPASTVVAALREFGLSVVVGTSSMIAVAAWNAPVSFPRFNLLVIGGALVVVIALVWSLGAGLHGLGRRNLGWLVGVAFVLLLVLTYASAVRSYGSQTLIEGVDDLVIWMRTTVGGVPRPFEVLIGFPALIVGVSLRSRRREGWWVLVFAVIGTGVLSTSLVSPGAYPTYIVWSTVYSIVLGGALGLLARFLVIRRPSDRRARVVVPEERTEPGRLEPLR